MTQITLYRADLACSWVPHALLRHLSIPFTDVPLRSRPDDGRYEAADGSFTHEEYRRDVHPDGYVPSLAVDGEVVTETPAVLAMIAQLAPGGAAMLGRTPLERVRVVEWLAWLSGPLQAAGFKAYWRPGRSFVDGHGHEEAHPAIREKGRRVIEACFERVEERLRGRRYAVGGDAPTVVDISLYLFWVWGNFIEIPMGQRFPAWAEVLRRVMTLQGVREAAEAEGMTLYF
ncbi:glutathione S-transferase [Biscogniauxia mediterranea]|nr:glutathione S-transferase [Biscogniauxia mediterranea]